MSYFNPVFLYDEKTHKPAQEGDQLTPASVPVSKAEGNVLKTSDDGLGVSVDDIKSPASGNAIKIASDGGLFVDIPVIPVYTTQCIIKGIRNKLVIAYAYDIEIVAPLIEKGVTLFLHHPYYIFSVWNKHNPPV